MFFFSRKLCQKRKKNHTKNAIASPIDWSFIENPLTASVILDILAFSIDPKMHKISIFDDALLLCHVYWTKYAPKVAVFFPHTGTIFMQNVWQIHLPKKEGYIHVIVYNLSNSLPYHSVRFILKVKIRSVNWKKETRINETNIAQCDAVPFYIEIDDVLSVSLFKTWLVAVLLQIWLKNL